MKSLDWNDEAFAELRARIKTQDALQALDVLVEYGIAARHLDAGPGKHGYMRDFRFTASGRWPFSFTANQKHLLFYLRRAGARALGATRDSLAQWFDEVDERDDGELTIKVRTKADAARVISQLLEKWSSTAGDAEPRPSRSQETVVEDVDAIRELAVEATVRESLVLARIGQGQFRRSVLALWDSRCCVTGSRTLDAIRASHIKSWKESDNAERLDPHNGLPLIATLDALFDAGLISFSKDGEMLVSSKLSNAERELLGVERLMLARRPSADTAKYLEWHRANVFAIGG